MRIALGPAAVVMADQQAADEVIPASGWGSRGFVTWGDWSIDLPALSSDELDTLGVLGGPPVWGR